MAGARMAWQVFSVRWQNRLREFRMVATRARRKDAATSCCMPHAGIALQDLSNFFDGLMHDVKKAYGDPRFGWPNFPSDDWKIPPEYGFKE